ncbi:MAG: T9SS type A sorting domain-containing protein, partial [Ignavibacteria bacterium]|nr:T9SS type A sorting domain-containing protein [Ignavibacteria bacterium]
GTDGYGCFLSTDSGTSWNAVNTGLTNKNIYSLTVVSNQAGGVKLIAGTHGDGVFISTNNGTSWEAFNTGLANKNVNAIAVDRQAIYAGTNSGVFLSTNNGTSWTSFNTGLANTFINVLAINNTNLFAGTSDGGVWKRGLSDATTSVKSATSNLPVNFKLDQNYPNPFNPETTISYKLQAASNVSLKVYDVLGNEVATLVNEYQQAGNYNSQFAIRNSSPRPTQVGAGQLTSGIYFYTLKAGSFSSTKKMLLIK